MSSTSTNVYSHKLRSRLNVCTLHVLTRTRLSPVYVICSLANLMGTEGGKASFANGVRTTNLPGVTKLSIFHPCKGPISSGVSAVSVNDFAAKERELFESERRNS